MVKMLATCKGCRKVKVLLEDGREYWQESIVDFHTLPKEDCWECKKKAEVSA